MNTFSDRYALDTKQLAALLGVHPRTVVRLVQRGELPPPIRLGPRILRWRVTDIERAIEQRSRGDARAR